MVTHYEPYADSEEEAHPFCRTKSSENTLTDNHWDSVSCKKCLKLKDKAKAYVEETEKHILKDMQGMVDFWKKEKTLQS
ncbi:MAG: hypothetical protein WC026_13150 [Hyphomicrobium sp.]|uniref:hypothetical protein n=1 Tax=Hyphomicrobium sp. TaxID=82 RepID=UPI00356958E4